MDNGLSSVSSEQTGALDASKPAESLGADGGNRNLDLRFTKPLSVYTGTDDERKHDNTSPAHSDGHLCDGVAPSKSPRRKRLRFVGGTLAGRLAARSDASAGGDACWPFLGHRNADGYGMVCYEGREYLAHRLALAIKLGRDLGPGEVARHSCHVRDCVNPAHLSVGSAADNIRDMVQARRQAVGEGTGNAKLTADQVLEIRRRCGQLGHGRFEQLGREYGVSGKEISNIFRGKRWRHSIDWCVDFNAAARGVDEVSGVILARAVALLERARDAA